MASDLKIKKKGNLNVEDITQLEHLLSEIDEYNKREEEAIARSKAEREKWLESRTQKNGKQYKDKG
jgi:hypothetical protein